MSSFKYKLGKVRIKPGFFEDENGRQITDLATANEVMARCGFGMDKCNGVFHFTDLGDGVHKVLYLLNGAVTVKTWALFQSEGA